MEVYILQGRHGLHGAFCNRLSENKGVVFDSRRG